MYKLSRNLVMGGAILLLSVLVSCSDDKEKKTVVCWGDSLTASHTNVGGNGIKQFLKETFMGDDSYPGVLQDLLGYGYNVVNCGVGGENTLTIMARLGAYPMLLAHDVVLFNGGERKFDTVIGNNDIPTFISSYDHKSEVFLLLQGGFKEDAFARVNPVVACHFKKEGYRIIAQLVKQKIDRFK